MRLKQKDIKSRIKEVTSKIDFKDVLITKEYIREIYSREFINTKYPDNWGTKRISNLLERDYFYLFVNMLKSKYTTNNLSATGITEGYVYFLVHPQFPDAVKIGSTIDIEDRLSAYNVGCPRKEYKIIYYFPSSNRLEDERQLQKLLQPKQLKGEWFNLSLSRTQCKILARNYSSNAITF